MVIAMTLKEQLTKDLDTYPSHFRSVLEDLLKERDMDLSAAYKMHQMSRDANEKFSVDYMFHWSIMTHLDDIIHRLVKQGNK